MGLAAPVFALADDLEDRDDPVALAEEARRRIAAFEAAARAAGHRQETLPAACYALAAAVDAAVRRASHMPRQRWSAAARTTLFDGRDVTAREVHRLARRAAKEPERYAALSGLLEACLARCDEAGVPPPEAPPETRSSTAGRWVSGAVAVVLLLLAGAAAVWLDWRHGRATLASFDEVVTAGPAGPGLPMEIAWLGAVLAAAEQAGRAEAPVGLGALVGASAPGAEAYARYRGLARERLAPVLGDLLSEALQNEGDAAQLFAAVRAAMMLRGELPWQPGRLGRWAEDRAGEAGSGLALHVAALEGPPATLAPVDAALLAEARTLAREASLAELAWLDLSRSDAAAALPEWRPTEELPRLADAFIMRSGAELAAPLAGLVTAAGRALAESGETAAAISAVRLEAPAVLGARLEDTSGDAAAARVVRDLLDAETAARWSAFLQDLRVRPFATPDDAIEVTAVLSAQASPLAGIIEALKREAGAEDVENVRARAAFGELLAFDEAGGTAEVARVFGAMNVAVARGRRQGGGEQEEEEDPALTALRAEAQALADRPATPSLFAHVLEDVVVQTAPRASGGLRERIEARWRSGPLAACMALRGRYPLGAGPEIGLADFAALLGPGGAIDAFFAGELATLADRSESPWRWSPEARIAGFEDASIAFFEAAAALREALFSAEGVPFAEIGVSELAQSGGVALALGGVAAPGEGVLHWPGPAVERGAELLREGGAGVPAAAFPGAWGLMRLFDAARLRLRDTGRRALADIPAADARLFVELTFAAPANPMTARTALAAFDCPQVL